MEQERWRQIEQLFHSALECEPPRRSSFLDEACAGDLALRQEVESLLASHEKDGFTETPAPEELMKVLEERESQSLAGQRIGPYKVIRRIGQGGMGDVYLATRADEAFRKEVAIKVTRRGLDTEDVIRRFRSERQILAGLDHPNITRLLDGGATEDGLPYFVMEYIQGEPIDKYCNEHKLNTTERLRLFQQVCSAVQYAHQNLVIHRDIKPGNVLVTAEGLPRLLDFGIAKLLARDPASLDDVATITIVRPMTPEYASPEQVRGEPITTASDVYSLGVLLYKLVTGHRPYRVTNTSQEALQRAICEELPQKPSTVIYQSEGIEKDGSITPESVSATREGTSDKLRRRLRGDLDNIILKALQKEPQRRYASVEQLSQDINRHLTNLPVIAQPDTAGYRAAKFVARHRAGVAGAALLIVILASGIAATSWQARVARAEGRRAGIEAAKARRVNAFLQEMLSFSSPSYVSPNPVKNPDAKVSEVVEQAAKRAETELADQPEVLAEMQRTIGEVYMAQGRYDSAEQQLRLALAGYIRLYGSNSAEIVEAADALANVLGRTGKTTEAEQLYRHDIEIERKQERQGHVDVRTMAYTLGDYGGLLDQRADKEAEGYIREGLRYATKLTGKDRIIVAMLNNDLGDVAYRRGDLKESERCNRAALDEYRKLPEGRYVEMGATLSNLGAVLIREGKYAEAEPFVRESLELRTKVLGNAHPDTAMSWFRLSDLLYKKGDYVGAESAAKESVTVFGRASSEPRNNVYLANPLMELGLILNQTGRFQEAETNLRDALEIRTRLLPKGNQLIGVTEGALGECLTKRKRYAEAEPFLLDSYGILKGSVVEHDPRLIDAARRLAVLYQSWQKPQKAAAYAASLPQSQTSRP